MWGKVLEVREITEQSAILFGCSMVQIDTSFVVRLHQTLNLIFAEKMIACTVAHCMAVHTAQVKTSVRTNYGRIDLTVHTCLELSNWLQGVDK